MLNDNISDELYDEYSLEFNYLIKSNFDNTCPKKSSIFKDNNNRAYNENIENFEKVFFTSTKKDLLKFFSIPPIQLLW